MNSPREHSAGCVGNPQAGMRRCNSQSLCRWGLVLLCSLFALPTAANKLFSALARPEVPSRGEYAVAEDVLSMTQKDADHPFNLLLPISARE